MGDYLDHLVSSQWADTNSTVRSSWIDSLADQVGGGFLADPAGAYQGDEKNPPSGLVSSSHINRSSCSEGMNSVPSDCSSVQLVSYNPRFTDGKGLVSSQHSPNKQMSHDNFLLQRGNDDGTSSGSLAFQINKATQIAGSQRSSELPIIGGSAKPASRMPDGGLAAISGCKMPGYQKLGESLSMPLPSWSMSYSDISTFPLTWGQGKLDGFNLQGDFAERDKSLLGVRYLGENIPLISEQNNLQSSSLAAGPQVPLPQNPVAATIGGCNGSVRPRVRARRGQATDPHSIAERTDKASMLDEIVEYVKFLQLHVKVLSMSRLGATEAVVPLITDALYQGSGSLQLSASVAHSADLPETQESIAFEQEVVKLMESNVTSAMQHLQTKGLCLMPIALATAISGEKAPPSWPLKIESSNSRMPSPNFSFTGQRLQASSRGGESLVKDIRPKCEREECSTNNSGCVTDVSQ